jgi:heme/copper-type cytochrome/quinol oxidase subunit 2
MKMSGRYWSFVVAFAAAVSVLVVTARAQPFDTLRVAPRVVEGQEPGQVREFTIVGDHYAFSPSTIVVNQNDVVKITFIARDIPHSFVVDDVYRISKRAGRGQTVTFQFRADKNGGFPFYCNLTQDPKCKDMKGMLTVK